MAIEKRLWLYALLIVLSTASSLQAAWPSGFDPRYVAAVADAEQTLTADKIDYHLTTIGVSDHLRSVQIDNHGVSQNTILTTNFGSWDGYSRAYQGTTAKRPALWAAVAPEMWQFVQTNGVAPQDMSLRAKQLLGLPETHSGYFVLEFYIKPASLFRPAMDPDITHAVTSLAFSGAMADPNSDMRKWYDANFSTYDPSKGTPYPWARTGYTYDWGIDVAPHIGLSEFIADNQNLTPDPTKGETYKENNVWVRSVISLVSYKYYVRDANTLAGLDSFSVTDWCDTIWIGTKYLPATVGGNWIDIYPNVTISGGEGIVVADRTDVVEPSNVIINNAGTIQGPGANHRNSSVTFTNAGGTLNNTGTITGDLYGVYGDDSCARAIVINNTGTIRGSQFAVRTGGGDDVVNTSGLIDGNIHGGPGNNTINVLGGSITGYIDGGSLTGTNTLNFNLPGDVTFAFYNNILEMSRVNVNSGTAILNGQVSGDVTVASGAVFGGVCTILSALNNGGAVAPGSSIGTITIGGNYSQTAGGRLIAEVAKPSSSSFISDKLNVTGAATATLAAGSTIEVRNGSGSGSVFRTGDAFTVISAGGGLTDGGAIVAFDSAFLNVTGSAGAKDYIVTLSRTATFSSAAAAGNNASMAAALDADDAAAAGGYAALMNQLLFTGAPAFNGSLQQLSPAAYLTANAASDRTAQYLAESTGTYLRGRRAGQINPLFFQTSSYLGSSAFAQAVGSPVELAGAVKYCVNERTTIRELQESDRTRSVWVNPFGVFFGERSNGDHLGFQSNAAGLQFGIDKQFDEHCILGIGGGYDQTHLDTNDLYSSGEIETFRVGPYATWFNDEWYMDSSLTGGFHDNDLGRLVNLGGADSVARGAYRADDLSFYLGGGRDWRVGECTLSPLLSVQYIYYRQNDFVETGAEGANLAVDPKDGHSLRSRVGGQLTRVYRRGATKIVPEVFAGWAHEYLANEPLEARFLGGATRFSTDRGGIFRDAGYYGVSLTAIPRDHASLFVRYNGEYSTGGHFTAVDLGLVVEF